MDRVEGKLNVFHLRMVLGRVKNATFFMPKISIFSMFLWREEGKAGDGDGLQ